MTSKREVQSSFMTMQQFEALLGMELREDSSSNDMMQLIDQKMTRSLLMLEQAVTIVVVCTLTLVMAMDSFVANVALIECNTLHKGHPKQNLVVFQMGDPPVRVARSLADTTKCKEEPVSGTEKAEDRLMQQSIYHRRDDQEAKTKLDAFPKCIIVKESAVHATSDSIRAEDSAVPPFSLWRDCHRSIRRILWQLHQTTIIKLNRKKRSI